MRILKLTLAYDGTDFHGWQTQRGVRTVQSDLERVLTRVLGHPVRVVGASRTDSGVHARGQTAHFLTSSPMPASNLGLAIGYRTPPDLSILQAADVSPEFHARRDALGKLYRYTIRNVPRQPRDPFSRRYAWHVWYPLDLAAMRAAAAGLIGTHDFSAFASQGSPRPSSVRTIRSIEIRRTGEFTVPQPLPDGDGSAPVRHGDERIEIDVAGDGFLYNQVRNIVGTLVEVGRGHWRPERVAAILVSRDRSRAGPTAPAHGLCLERVEYAVDGRV